MSGKVCHVSMLLLLLSVSMATEDVVRVFIWGANGFTIASSPGPEYNTDNKGIEKRAVKSADSDERMPECGLSGSIELSKHKICCDGVLHLKKSRISTCCGKKMFNMDNNEMCIQVKGQMESKIVLI